MRGRRALALALLLAPVAGCNALLSLGDYEKVDCVACEDGGFDAGREDVVDGGVDDALPDVGPDVPVLLPPMEESLPLVRRWARWPMPGALPDASALVVEGDAAVRDAVTRLVWARTVEPAVDYAAALTACAARGAGWKVPTRIELATLLVVDPDRPRPAWSAVFDEGDGSVAPRLWTASRARAGSSAVPAPHFVVDFATGGVAPGAGDAVRCVRLASP